MSDLPLENASLKELADRLARGEEAAFAELYDACAGQLHRYLAARLGSQDAASDVVQNAFLRAVKSRRRFRSVENPVAYLFQIARNESARAVAKRGVATSLPLEELLGCTNDEVEDAEVAAVALRRLDLQDREVVEMKIFGGLTFREIAAIVDRPQATVATQYRRALESLREWLAKQYR
jgi:RNA polymerase sigma-70 factor, ECF subfamily